MGWVSRQSWDQARTFPGNGGEWEKSQKYMYTCITKWHNTCPTLTAVQVKLVSSYCFMYTAGSASWYMYMLSVLLLGTQLMFPCYRAGHSSTMCMKSSLCYCNTPLSICSPPPSPLILLHLTRNIAASLSAPVPDTA